MNRTALRIVFMGTPAFAVPSLEALTAAGHPVVTVVTQPDRPKGRGRQTSPPPVKIAAQRVGLKVIQPFRLNDPAVLPVLEAAAADVFVVVAYGQILSPTLLALPRLGAVNVHASLLPRYRGPAPIQWAIINRDGQTGVTTMRMDAGLDTGPILLSAATPIDPAETAATLYPRLADMGAELLVATLARMAAGNLIPTPQDSAAATYAPLLTKADGRIDWTRPAAEIEARVRGLNPWPGAFTHCGAQRWKIWRIRPTAATLDAVAAGTVIPGFSDELRVMTGEGAVVIEELQGPSGKRLSAAAFLRGNPVAPGCLLT
jgi:methionyl-tRNA formyltransferase